MILRVGYDDVEEMGIDAGGGVIYYYKGEPFTGIIEEFANGILIGEAEFTNGHHGGVQREYYKNGQIQEEYTIWFNKLEGVLTLWDEAGNITSQTH